LLYQQDRYPDAAVAIGASRPKRVDDGSEMTAAKLPFAACGDCDYDLLK
jgi:hypothetical protein